MKVAILSFVFAAICLTNAKMVSYVRDVPCDGGTCPDGHTCCSGDAKPCCPTPNGVCCGNSQCCPSGYTCRPPYCVRDDAHYESVILSKSHTVKKMKQYQKSSLTGIPCKGGECPFGYNTCCPNEPKPCCKYSDAVCCGDGTCCPSGYTCSGDYCLREDAHEKGVALMLSSSGLPRKGSNVTDIPCNGGSCPRTKDKNY